MYLSPWRIHAVGWSANTTHAQDEGASRMDAWLSADWRRLNADKSAQETLFLMSQMSHNLNVILCYNVLYYVIQVWCACIVCLHLKVSSLNLFQNHAWIVGNQVSERTAHDRASVLHWFHWRAVRATKPTRLTHNLHVLLFAHHHINLQKCCQKAPILMLIRFRNEHGITWRFRM